MEFNLHKQMLHILPTLIRVTVTKRPSAKIKSPYVADIRLEDGTEALCHTPGLSCCGLVSAGKIIYVSKSTEKAKTDYTAQIAECSDSEGAYYVGIHPMISQHIASKLLYKISSEAKWKSEEKISDHTRLDFVGSLPNGKKIYVEVKNAMISTNLVGRQERRAIFPEGYRKSKKDTISPRAVKHAETLGELVEKPDTDSAYLLYIVPRNDCNSLELNKDDPTYVHAVTNAVNKGVHVKVFGLNFITTGGIEFNKELEFHLPV